MGPDHPYVSDVENNLGRLLLEALASSGDHVAAVAEASGISLDVGGEPIALALFLGAFAFALNTRPSADITLLRGAGEPVLLGEVGSRL